MRPTGRIMQAEPYFRGETRIGSRGFTHQTYRIREHALAEVREWLARLTAEDFAAGDIEACILEVMTGEREPVLVPPCPKPMSVYGGPEVQP